MTWVRATHASRVAARVKMSVIKVMLAAATTMALTLPAFAGDCYKQRAPSDKTATAGQVVIKLDNRGKSGIAVYVTDTDGRKFRFWLEAGEKIAPTIELRRRIKCPDKSDFCPKVARNDVALSYSPFSSEIDLLKFSISNEVDGLDKETRYNPVGSPRQSVSCFLSWRPNKERWDMDLKFN